MMLSKAQKSCLEIKLELLCIVETLKVNQNICLDEYQRSTAIVKMLARLPV